MQGYINWNPVAKVMLRMGKSDEKTAVEMLSGDPLAFFRQNITDQEILTVIKGAMGATYTKIVGKDEEGEEVVHEIPDHKTRLGGVDRAIEISGRKPTEKIEEYHFDMQMVKEFQAEVLDEIGKVDAKLKERIIKRLKEKGIV